MFKTTLMRDSSKPIPEGMMDWPDLPDGTEYTYGWKGFCKGKAYGNFVCLQSKDVPDESVETIAADVANVFVTLDHDFDDFKIIHRRNDPVSYV